MKGLVVQTHHSQMGGLHSPEEGGLRVSRGGYRGQSFSRGLMYPLELSSCAGTDALGSGNHYSFRAAIHFIWATQKT